MIVDGIEAKLHGISTLDQYGKQIVIFIDVLRFTADNFTAYPVINISSHAATLPYTSCRFDQRKKDRGFAYSYSTIISRRKPSHIYRDHRNIYVRFMGLSEIDQKHLDLQSGSISSLSVKPLFRYYR